MDLCRGDVRDFFRFASDLCGWNLILDPEVRGGLDLHVSGIRADRLFLMVMRLYNLGYQTGTVSKDHSRPTAIPANRHDEWTGAKIEIGCIKELTIADAFRMIGDEIGKAVAVEKRVQGELGFPLHDVPWDQAVDLICHSYGLDCTVDDDMIVVKATSVEPPSRQGRRR